jgi:hypothetical protein
MEEDQDEESLEDPLVRESFRQPSKVAMTLYFWTSSDVVWSGILPLE